MIFKHQSNINIKLTGVIKTSTKGMDRFFSYIGCGFILLAIAVLVYVIK